MAKKPTVRIRDKGYNKLLKSAVRSQEGAISIGVHPREGRERYPGTGGRQGPTIADVARLHRSGTRRMPRRDAIGTWFEGGGQRRIRDATRRALERSLVTGKSPKPTLERAGARYVEQVRATFARLAPLARSTVERKRSSRILIETGALSRAITYRVNLGKKAGKWPGR